MTTPSYVFTLTALQMHPPTKEDLDALVGIYPTEAAMLAAAERLLTRAEQEGRQNGLQVVGAAYELGDSYIPTADGNYVGHPVRSYYREDAKRWRISTPPPPEGGAWTTSTLVLP